MRSVIVASLLAAAAVGPAVASDCPGNPDAIGVSRTLVVDPTEHRLLGALSYRESLPLNDHEVVLTFDDGPLPPYTSRILDTLASQCVKATFFMVGRMAQGYPKLVQRVAAEGHTIANHSQNHPFTFHKMPVERAAHEIEQGFTSIRTALGNPEGVAPFFRFPGLLHQPAVESYLTQHDLMAWSVDVVADDWTHISSKEVVRRAINRLEARGKGILLLHDIQPATAAGLPELLAELKARGFKIVQVVPVGPGRVKTATLPQQWTVRHAPSGIWPEPPPASLVVSQPVLDAPSPRSFGVAETPGAPIPVAATDGTDKAATLEGEAPLSPMAIWPHGLTVSGTEALPAPSKENFRYWRVWHPRKVTRTAAHGAHKFSNRKTAPHKDKDVVGSIGTTAAVPHIAATTHRPPGDVGSRRGVQRKPGAGSTERQRPQQGHQIQIPKPAAEIPSPPAESPKPTAGLFGSIFP
jgi:peptidoglycan/xylan/chitin deacetylase (PgdA/CDA1 family)